MSEKTQEVEVACSLTDAESRERRSLVRETLFPHITTAEKIATGLKLTFPNSALVRSNVEEFVGLERQCCGFLTFDISPSEQGLVLTIDGPAEAEATLEKFSVALGID